MSEPIIEKGVPIPARKPAKEYGYYTELLGKLEPGDSFVAEGNINALNSAIRQSAKRLGIKVTARREKGDQGETKLRVWRLPDADTTEESK